MNLLDVMVNEETGEKRAVLGVCPNCKRTYEGRDAEPEHFAVISLYQIAHIGADYGMTACGKDATGPNWWWPI